MSRTTYDIMQWNCRGFGANKEELCQLAHSYSPSIICLQETFLSDSQTTINPYISHHCFSVSANTGRPIGGSSILVHHTLPHSRIQINTDLQAVACRVELQKNITICSVYIPPNFDFSIQQLQDLFDQLPSPVLLLGDFNAHSELWGNGREDRRGSLLETFISNNSLCLFNDESPTYCHPASGSLTSIDLSISDAVIFPDFSWSVHNDLCGSDHFPIFLQCRGLVENNRYPTWN